KAGAARQGQQRAEAQVRQRLEAQATASASAGVGTTGPSSPYNGQPVLDRNPQYPADNKQAATGAVMDVLDEMHTQRKATGKHVLQPMLGGAALLCTAWADEFQRDGGPATPQQKANMDFLKNTANEALRRSGSDVEITSITANHHSRPGTVPLYTNGHDWIEMDVQYRNAKGETGSARIRTETNYGGAISFTNADYRSVVLP
ncbi:MAG: hypothetical protein AB2A00_15635, partial [Myxococcota bacterium]